ncbi:MAG: hypothetical protein AAFO63_10215 [Pseudomonadota bacterium]
MSRRSNIIQFPASARKGDKSYAEIEAEQLKRAEALPQWAKELDVKWIYRDIAKRKVDRRF